jgi:hypothetical protein
VGQVDTFEDGTTQGWQINLLGFGVPPAGAMPSNQATGGPAGVNDNYLQLASVGGSGAGSRLAAINTSQWAGDYLAANITSIQMHLNNLGATDLSLRLMFADPIGGSPTNLAYSTNAIFLPGGSGWTQVSFPIAPANLTAGLGSINAALANVTDFRLYHSPTANYPNPGSPVPAIVATLGVDNIRAVPEPSLLALGFTCLPLISRRRRDH